MTSEDDWRNAVTDAVSRFGKGDILVNNAGISTRGGIAMTPEERQALTSYAVGILEINMLDTLRQHPGVDRKALQVAMDLPGAEGCWITGQIQANGNPYKYRLENDTPK